MRKIRFFKGKWLGKPKAYLLSREIDCNLIQVNHVSKMNGVLAFIDFDLKCVKVTLKA